MCSLICHEGTKTSEIIAAFGPHIGTNCRWMVKVSLYPRDKTTVLNEVEGGWDPGSVWVSVEMGESPT
jgi:hypothetical protein